jgi:MoxR-like ATPase
MGCSRPIRGTQVDGRHYRSYIRCRKARFVTLPKSIDDTLALLASAHYLADRSLATVLFLALRMGRPIFLEGEAGVGKTEIGKVLAATLSRRLIRLQCYEGLDIAAAVYEWNYAAQMITIRLAEAEGAVDRERLSHDVFSEQFLIKRPLLQALEPDTAGAPVLLIDELDRTDEAFEAFLLEVLSDFQITIPELGTVKAAQPPAVIITSNRTREIHDALKRRCCRRRSCISCRRCAGKTCSSRRASPRRSTGQARSPSLTPSRLIRRRCRTRSACC